MVAGTRLGCAAELRKDHHRDVQLFREQLEAARQRADLLVAVLVTRAGAHQLQVVDNDHRQAVLVAQPPVAALKSLHNADEHRPFPRAPISAKIFSSPFLPASPSQSATLRAK